MWTSCDPEEQFFLHTATQLAPLIYPIDTKFFFHMNASAVRVDRASFSAISFWGVS